MTVCFGDRFLIAASAQSPLENKKPLFVELLLLLTGLRLHGNRKVVNYITAEGREFILMYIVLPQ